MAIARSPTSPGAVSEGRRLKSPACEGPRHVPQLLDRIGHRAREENAITDARSSAMHPVSKTSRLAARSNSGAAARRPSRPDRADG